MNSVSVIITCFREGRLLNAAVESVLNQTTKSFELIIVNDSSTDDSTNEICRKFEEKGIAVYRTERNIGPSGARNLGIMKASGDIIIPLDGDDTLPSDAVEKISGCFEQYPDCDFVYGNYSRTDLPDNNTSLINCESVTGESNYIDPEKLLSNWILLGMTPHTKRIWERVGGYSMKYSYTCQDVDFQMRACLAGAKFIFINSVIYNWHRAPGGVNSSEKNSKALSSCWYDNIDFIIRYSSFHKDGLSLALEHSDYKRVRQWAINERAKGRNSSEALIFSIIPYGLLPFTAVLYRFAKRKLH